MDGKGMDRNVIMIVCGLPGSGKSTLSEIIHGEQKSIYIDIDAIERYCHSQFNDKVNQIHKQQHHLITTLNEIHPTLDNLEYKQSFQNALINDILSQVIANTHITVCENIKYEFNPMLWKISREVSGEVVERLVVSQKQCMIIIEDVFNLKSQRKTYFNLAYQHSLGFCEIHISMPLDQVILNDAQRQAYKFVGETVIKKAYDSFDSDPVAEEHFIKMNNSREQTLQQLSDQHYQDILRIGHIEINKSVATQMTDIEYANLIRTNKESITHQLDLKLRDKVSQLIKSPLYDIKTFAGGQGLSILKKLYFLLAENYLTNQTNNKNNNDNKIISEHNILKCGQLEKDFLKVFKSETKAKFKQIIEVMQENMMKEIENDSNEYEQYESIENKNRIQQFIEQQTSMHQQAFERTIQVIFHT